MKNKLKVSKDQSILLERTKNLKKQTLEIMNLKSEIEAINIKIETSGGL